MDVIASCGDDDSCKCMIDSDLTTHSLRSIGGSRAANASCFVSGSGITYTQWWHLPRAAHGHVEMKDGTRRNCCYANAFLSLTLQTAQFLGELFR